MRRQSGNPLYRKVLERYVNIATKEGVCQAVFPEGGPSRDGRLGPPKLGIFDYMLKLRHIVLESDGIYKVVPEEYDVLSYYANSIVHWITES